MDVVRAQITQQPPQSNSEGKIRDVIEDLKALNSSEHQRQVAQQCEDSLLAYSKSSEQPELTQSSLQSVIQALEQAQEEAEALLDHLAIFLMDECSFCPECNVYGTSLKVFQASGLASTSTIADVIRVTIHGPLMRVRLICICVLCTVC